MCKVQIKSVDNRTHLIIDGVDVSRGCTYFSLSQGGLDCPKITLTLTCRELDVDADVFKINVTPLNDKTAPTVADAVP